MNEIQKVKASLDPELYVNAVARWQAEKENASKPKQTAQVFVFPQAAKKAEQKPQQSRKRTPDPDFGARCTIAMFGVWIITVLAML